MMKPDYNWFQKYEHSALDLMIGEVVCMEARNPHPKVKFGKGLEEMKAAAEATSGLKFPESDHFQSSASNHLDVIDDNQNIRMTMVKDWKSKFQRR